MEKLRVTYSKFKEATYISHLDTVNVFETALRRANIPVSYSEGFNPRIEMVFASPISLGIESIGEIVEIMLCEYIPEAVFVCEMNKVLPSGITILSAEYADKNEKNIMSRVKSAIYEISIDYPNNMFLNKSPKEIEEIKKWYVNRLDSYLSQENLFILKEYKDRNERIDIKPLIYGYAFNFDGSLQINLATGSNSNLKPDTVMSGYMEYIQKSIDYIVKRIKIIYQ